ncbi:FecR domain-containing protein [Pseudomonas cremoricolorata]|uniref:FecR domain-containing protein n=1 Tax=Pseudomonas cremoricolorata TaxID=157783 RepID=UPI0003F7C940|nr:FecR domain-containing protein [Pseudomonas cremoricolorata]
MSVQLDSQARQLAREAAQWLARQDAGELDADGALQLQHWRARSAAHEALWQKAEQLRQRFSQVPPPIGLSCLDRPDPQRRKLLGQALALGAVAPLAWMAYRQLPITPWGADLATATGERRGVELADGSRVQLNTASALNITFEAGQPRLHLLRGEIAVDSVGPLQVQTRYGRIVAGAGSFCVREGEHDCQVSALRGELRLLPQQGSETLLKAGHRARLSASQVHGIQAFDPQIPGWQQGVLIVEAQPLGLFLRELDRYRPGVLRCQPSLERLAVTGTFALDDTDRILALLAASLPLHVQYRTRYWVSLSARGAVA